MENWAMEITTEDVNEEFYIIPMLDAATLERQSFL